MYPRFGSITNQLLLGKTAAVVVVVDVLFVADAAAVVVCIVFLEFAVVVVGMV